MIYLFNNNEEMIRIIPNSAIKRLYQTQTLTDENYISDRLDVEIQALNDEELSELEYMAIDDIENPQRFHYYFIVKETTEHQVTSLTGVQSGIEELRKTPVYDMRPTNLTPKLIADRLLKGTNWQAGYTTDDIGTISTNFYYTDVFSALKKMCMAFGIEMQFFVEITTNRIGARYIEFRKRTGKSVGKRVVYGHNALKIVKEVEKTNTVTALIGRGKGVQVSESDEGNIGYGRKIGIENVEWKTSSGAPVDKPLGQKFVEIPDLTLQYGIKNSNGTVRPKIGFVEFQDEESETRLIDRTYNALLELSRPQVLLETSSVYLPDTGIGDTINVVRHDRDLRYQTRVFEITWDRLANQAVDMKLGDRLGESENKRINNISNQISGNISTELGPTIDELIDRITTADGKNTNWYTEYDPMENPETMGLVRVNDNWWQPDPEFEGEFILKQWNGEMWVEILRTSGNPELVRRFEEIEQQAQGLADEIEASEARAAEKANQALQDAKDWATDLEGGLKINASQITAGEIETARLKVTEIVSQGLSGNEDSITQLVIADDLFQSSVTNLAQQKVADELEQEYETVTSRINNVTRKDGIEYGTDTSTYRYFDYPLESAITYGSEINVKFIMQGTTNTGQQMVLEHINSAGTVTNLRSMNLPTGESMVSFTIDATQTLLSSGSKIRLKIYGYKSYVAYFEMWYMKDHQVPIDGENTGAISSQITQLYNMINLSILGKDGAMSRIAMGEEGIQIDGKLLHITAKTYIDEAVIKSAMIDTLDAGKITTGELNASLIRVVNLDAQSIAGNEASFIRAMFSGTISTLQITSNGVSILDNLGRSSTHLDSSGIEFSRQGVNLGKLEYVTNTADAGDLNNMHGFSMRPNRNSYFGVSYFPTTSATNSIRRFAVSGRTGNVYISGLIKPSEQQIYGIDITWGTITNVGTNVRIMNHDGTGGIQINNGDISYKIHDGTWRSLNSKLG